MNKLKLKIPPPLQVLVCVVAMWALSCYFPFAPHLLPYNYFIAAIFAVAGTVFIAPAVRQFLKVQTTMHPMHPQESTVLVTDGIYKISRNPMYVGLWLILNAVAFFLNALTPFVVIIFFLLYIENFQVKPEEEALNQLFGERYEEYKKKVRRWL